MYIYRCACMRVCVCVYDLVCIYIVAYMCVCVYVYDLEKDSYKERETNRQRFCCPFSSFFRQFYLNLGPAIRFSLDAHYDLKTKIFKVFQA